MRVFVAGGTGIKGSAAIHALVSCGRQVRSTARSRSKAASIRLIGAEPIKVDLFGLQEIRNAIRSRDALIRLTTKIKTLSVMRSQRLWKLTNEPRTIGAITLVDAAITEAVITQKPPAFLATGCMELFGTTYPVLCELQIKNTNSNRAENIVYPVLVTASQNTMRRLNY